MSNIIAFSTEDALVEMEYLPDHIRSKQARMLLALFELKDAINDLTRWLKAVQTVGRIRTNFSITNLTMGRAATELHASLVGLSCRGKACRQAC